MKAKPKRYFTQNSYEMLVSLNVDYFFVLVLRLYFHSHCYFYSADLHIAGGVHGEGVLEHVRDAEQLLRVDVLRRQDLLQLHIHVLQLPQVVQPQRIHLHGSLRHLWIRFHLSETK